MYPLSWQKTVLWIIVLGSGNNIANNDQGGLDYGIECCPRLFTNTAAQYGGTRWRSWLRHCATSRKGVGSIPDGVIGIFHWHNPSGRTMVLGLTQPLTEMSIRNISWGYSWPVCKADNLTTFMCRMSWNLGASASWNPQGLSRPVMGLLYLYLFTAQYRRMCNSQSSLNAVTVGHADNRNLIVQRCHFTESAKSAGNLHVND